MPSVTKQTSDAFNSHFTILVPLVWKSEEHSKRCVAVTCKMSVVVSQEMAPWNTVHFFCSYLEANRSQLFKKLPANCEKPKGSLPRYAVAQLVEALRYKSEGSGFDSRLGHWNFSLT